jgi:hypothetical protein
LTKRCPGCDTIRPIDDFNKSKRNKAGRQTYCKECKSLNYQENKEKRKEQMRINYNSKKAEYAERASAYQQAHKEEHNKRNRSYHKRKPGIRRASVARRNAAKLQRTPKALTKAQLREIRDIYEMAAELSWLSEGGLHVDHIMPLRGKNSSGLHVPWNLQIIPAKANLRKGNKIL